MKKFVFAFALLSVFSAVALADIRLPDTPKPAVKNDKSIDSRMTIRLSADATEARLIIPKSQLKEFRAALDEADDAADSNAALTTATGNFSRAQTIVSGLFMSLAPVFGGVWFARSRSSSSSNSGKNDAKPDKKIIAVVVIFLVGAAATLVYANAGPPPGLRSIDGGLFNKKVFGSWNFASGNIKVEISNTARNIELIVPDKPGNPNGGEE